MSDAGTVEGLATVAPRKTLGQGAAELWRKYGPRRRKSEAVVTPVAVADEVRLDEPVVEVEAKAKAPLTRETFADASADEIVAFLKGLDVTETEGADRPQAEVGELGFFGLKLTSDEKAAVLRLRTGAPVAEGEEDTTAADVALLKAKFAITPAVAEAAPEVDETAGTDADLTARTAELLVLADRFAITTKDRAALALLVGIKEFSDELNRIIADTYSAWKAQAEAAPVADVAEGESPVPLAFEERAQASFDALISALEARESEASAPADVEQAQALAVDAGGEHKDDDVVIVAAVEEGHGDDKRTD